MTLVFVYGGNSLESDISEVTFKKINKLLINSKYNIIGVFLNHDGEFFLNNKKGFFYKKGKSYYFKIGFKKYYFDLVIPLVHGKGSEDGTIGAFFDTLRIPCVYSGILNSSLLQDKITFKQMMKLNEIPQTDFEYITYHEYMDINFDINKKILNLSFPLIVKPNCLGSSIGVKKVNTIDELIYALDKAFTFDNKVIVENAVLNLKEINIALIGDEINQLESELETVSNKEDVLSYFDKYLLGKEKTTRIIPADISNNIKEEIVKISKNVFKKLDCFGIVRFDYLYDEKEQKIYLNEVNTIPGSLAYYLFLHKNITVEQLIEKLIKLHEKRTINEERLLHIYHEGNRKDLLSKE